MNKLNKILYTISIGFIIGILSLVTAVIILRVVFNLVKFI
jgi:TRAP-type C4-dicarboxylate transport system permease small subunit